MELAWSSVNGQVEPSKGRAAQEGDESGFCSSGPLYKYPVILAASESTAKGSSEKERAEGFLAGSRKPIKKLTQSSRDRLRFKIRNSLCVWTCLTTLTYPKRSPRDGRIVKKHLNTFLTALRRDYPGIRYMWWLEFQKRGAPHIHLITTCPFPALTYISLLWYKIVGSKNKKHLMLGADVRPFYGNLSGDEIAEIYATKMDQKAKPAGYSNVGRYWGCSNNLTEPVVFISGLSEASAEEVRALARTATEKCQSSKAINSGNRPGPLTVKRVLV